MADKDDKKKKDPPKKQEKPKREYQNREVWVICPLCDGSGTRGNVKCTMCDGKKKIRATP